MAKQMEEPAGGLGRDELEILEAYITRARLLEKPRRDELKAIVLLKRAIRRLKDGTTAGEPGVRVSRQATAPPVMPQIYGNHQFIPDDWLPSPQTLQWTVELLQERDVEFDIRWLVEEFITYWKSRGQKMANWQQAFKHNILSKLGRGIPCAPQETYRPQSGWPQTRINRVFDRSAELREQRLNDFDREARDIVERSRRPGGKTPGPVGEGD